MDDTLEVGDGWNEEAAEEAWAHLKPLADTVAGPNDVLELKPRDDNRWELGRGDECTILWAHDSRISRKHCVLEMVDDEIRLTNLSKVNPTYVDAQRLAYNESTALSNGAVIYLLKKPADDPKDKIGFVFHIGPHNGPDDLCLTNATPPTSPQSKPSPAPKHKQSPAQQHSKPTSQKQQNDNEDEDEDVQQQPPQLLEKPKTPKKQKREASPDQDDEKPAKKKHKSSSSDSLPKSSFDSPHQSPVVAKAAAKAVLSPPPSSHVTSPAIPNPVASTFVNLSQAASSLVAPALPVSSPISSPVASHSETNSALEDSMMCMICHSIFYKCVTLLPCLHNACAACWSDCMKHSTQCPQCRASVEEVRRNHTLASIVEEYLKANPHKQRDPDELKEMDDRNQIKDESLRMKRKRRKEDSDSDDDDDDDDDGSQAEEDNDEDDDDDEEETCAECHTAGLDGHRCQPGAQHVYCHECRRCMPLRTYPPNTPIPRPQTCQRCNQHFCGAYFPPCHNFSTPTPTSTSFVFGLGARLFNMGTATVQPQLATMAAFDVLRLPTETLSNNDFEKSVLLNYIANSGTSLTVVVRTMAQRVISGEITDATVLQLVNNDPVHCVMCYRCAEPLVIRLLYLYRLQITPMLPSAVTSRQDCWYGRNCRTQQHNQQHAAKLNHVCEPSRQRR